MNHPGWCRTDVFRIRNLSSATMHLASVRAFFAEGHSNLDTLMRTLAFAAMLCENGTIISSTILMLISRMGDCSRLVGAMCQWNSKMRQRYRGHCYSSAYFIRDCIMERPVHQRPSIRRCFCPSHWHIKIPVEISKLHWIYPFNRTPHWYLWPCNKLRISLIYLRIRLWNCVKTDYHHAYKLQSPVAALNNQQWAAIQSHKSAALAGYENLTKLIEPGNQFSDQSSFF